MAVTWIVMALILVEGWVATRQDDYGTWPEAWRNLWVLTFVVLLVGFLVEVGRLLVWFALR